MWRASWACVVLTMVACGDDTRCPPDTTEKRLPDLRGDGASMRYCMLADGVTPHGPLVEVDERGRERLVGRFVRGKREGRFDYRNRLMRTDATFKNGQPHGVYRIYIDGQLSSEDNYQAGRKHGDTTWWKAGRKIAVQHHVRGVPSGTWHWYADDGSSTRQQTYGNDGALLVVDGKPVPPPPARIELANGTAIDRRECVRRTEKTDFDSPVGCLALFERMQLCTDDACTTKVIEDASAMRW